MLRSLARILILAIVLDTMHWGLHLRDVKHPEKTDSFCVECAMVACWDSAPALLAVEIPVPWPICPETESSPATLRILNLPTELLGRGPPHSKDC